MTNLSAQPIRAEIAAKILAAMQYDELEKKCRAGRYIDTDYEQLKPLAWQEPYSEAVPADKRKGPKGPRGKWGKLK